MYRQVVWSPVEITYLQSHLSDPLNQLTIALAKSRNAITNKILEIQGKEVPSKKKVKNNRSRIGKRKDCNNLFFRSGMEANCYRLFKDMDHIASIEYEPVDFGFYEFGIKKGTVSYTPDFRITYKNGTQVWIEVKGFLKAQDKVKMRRFKKFYPLEASKLQVIVSSKKSKTGQFFVQENIPILFEYNELNKQYKKVIPGWE